MQNLRFQNLQKISEKDIKDCYKELLYIEEYETMFLKEKNSKKSFYEKKNIKERINLIMKKKEDELLTNSWNKFFIEKKRNSIEIRKFVLA